MTYCFRASHGVEEKKPVSPVPDKRVKHSARIEKRNIPLNFGLSTERRLREDKFAVPANVWSFSEKVNIEHLITFDSKLCRHTRRCVSLWKYTSPFTGLYRGQLISFALSFFEGLSWPSARGKGHLPWRDTYTPLVWINRRNIEWGMKTRDVPGRKPMPRNDSTLGPHAAPM